MEMKNWMTNCYIIIRNQIRTIGEKEKSVNLRSSLNSTRHKYTLGLDRYFSYNYSERIAYFVILGGILFC